MPPFQDWFIELFQILNNLLVGIAAIIGIASLSKWRSETIGKARFGLARNMIRTALQFRDEFKSTRNALTLPHESADRKREENESPAQSLALDEWFARNKRLDRARKTILKLNELGWEAEAILSEDDAKLIQPFTRAYIELSNAIQSYFRDGYNEAQGRSIDTLFRRTMWDRVYGMGDDEFSKAVDNAVEAMKSQLKKYILK